MPISNRLVFQPNQKTMNQSLLRLRCSMAHLTSTLCTGTPSDRLPYSWMWSSWHLEHRCTIWSCDIGYSYLDQVLCSQDIGCYMRSIHDVLRRHNDRLGIHLHIVHLVYSRYTLGRLVRGNRNQCSVCSADDIFGKSLCQPVAWICLVLVEPHIRNKSRLFGMRKKNTLPIR